MTDSTPTKTGKPQLDALTSLRGLLAVWVVIFHFRTTIRIFFPERSAGVEAALRTGYMAVDLFFVLSGFVIALTYSTQFAAPSVRLYCDYLVKRLARIYPAYLTALLLSLLLWAVFQKVYVDFDESSPNYSAGRFVKNVLMIQGWTIPITKAWNIPDWSVSCEWFAYLLYPAYALTARRLRKKWAILVGLGSLWALHCSYLHVFGRDTATSVGLVRVVVCFGLGVLLHGLWSQELAWRRSRIWIVLGAGSLICAPILYRATWKAGGDALMWAPGFAAFTIWCFAQPGAQIALVSHKALLHLGKISYSIYLIHDLVLQVVRRVAPASELADAHPGTKVLYLVLVLLATIIAGHLLHTFVEAPARLLLLGREKPRDVVPAL